MPQWVRPDWRDHQAHQEALDGLPLSQWRWQWIRRHADYQAAWDDAPVQKNWMYQGIDGDPMTKLKPGVTEARSDADIDLLPGELVERRWDKHACEKYGMAWLIDPAIKSAPAVKGRPTVELRLPINMDWLQAQHDEGYAVLAVDLTRTETDIIEAVKQMVVNEKAAREIAEPPRQRKEWITYIRILDAYADGATPKQIADHLANGGDKVDENVVRRWYARALQEQEAAIAHLKK
jgi:hypothetical protein